MRSLNWIGFSSTFKFNHVSPKIMKSDNLFNEVMVIKLDINDLENCLALDLLTLNGIWTKTQWEDELRNPQKICIGIVKINQLIGFTCGTLLLDEIHITLIGIHPNYQRLGYGKLALDSLLLCASDKGVKTARLEVRASNYKAKLFYKSLYFKKSGLREGLYKDGSDAIIFTKNLSNQNKKLKTNEY